MPWLFAFASTTASVFRANLDVPKLASALPVLRRLMAVLCDFAVSPPHGNSRAPSGTQCRTRPRPHPQNLTASTRSASLQPLEIDMQDTACPDLSGEYFGILI